MMAMQCKFCSSFIEYKQFEKLCPYCEAPLGKPDFRYMPEEDAPKIPDGSLESKRG